MLVIAQLNMNCFLVTAMLFIHFKVLFHWPFRLLFPSCVHSGRNTKEGRGWHSNRPFNPAALGDEGDKSNVPWTNMTVPQSR